MTKNVQRAPAVRRKISKTLRGRVKTPEHRAAMAASKLHNREREPEKWQAAYAEKLRIIQAIEAIKKETGETH